MNKFELIIFDCDGVLVDSELIANQVFAKILEDECGLFFSLDDMYEHFVGHSAIQCMEILEEMLGTKPPDCVPIRYRKEIDAALAASVAPVSGIERALARLSLPCCVASSGSHEKMHMTLGKTNLLRRFEGRLHSTSDVDRGKPAPDIYRHAAQRMGDFEPGRCLVIEDSPPGVEAGVAAGMVVFGFAERMKEDRLIEAGAHHIFKHMGNLADEILRYKHSGL